MKAIDIRVRISDLNDELDELEHEIEDDDIHVVNPTRRDSLCNKFAMKIKDLEEWKYLLSEHNRLYPNDSEDW